MKINHTSLDYPDGFSIDQFIHIIEHQNKTPLSMDGNIISFRSCVNGPSSYCEDAINFCYIIPSITGTELSLFHELFMSKVAMSVKDRLKADNLTIRDGCIIHGEKVKAMSHVKMVAGKVGICTGTILLSEWKGANSESMDFFEVPSIPVDPENQESVQDSIDLMHSDLESIFWHTRYSAMKSSLLMISRLN